MEQNITVNPEAVVQGEKYRISILTEALLRLEYSESGIFEDRPTQAVINRNFPVPKFLLCEKEDCLTITTSKLLLEYDRKAFSPNGLSIRVVGNFSNYRSTWYYGTDFTDLGGTARTLDKADGAVPLERGLISKNGFSVYDDSESLIQTENGWVAPRERRTEDLYFFGYGHDYKQCLKDFYHLCGPMPVLPRYALGNWWSRYYKYTEQEYRDLILRFEKEHIPFSVAVMDMDWHLVDVDEKYGSGWTGYTWNRELFPEPEKLLKWLHEKKYRITLNVHPAAGVRAYEEAYLPMAKELGIDWKREETIEFDVTNQDFLNAYFKYLHHPNEESGVDFWWIDWQQQSHSKVKGLDPLWMLNHYHYLDSKRNGRKGLTFSRYAGIGSHRYPIGFSGDTYITWKSLEFQPYFTATASNAGYGWWSHDIGGHMHGNRDNELAVRWLQFGVFSPINRLHSSDNLFSGKEPWNFPSFEKQIMIRFLQLRHQMIPYLYSMNRMASKEGRPLMLPMYYEYPENPESYEQKNQYYFGTELMVAPVTSPMDCEAMLSEVTVWLPDGIWYDFFNGKVYKGGTKRNLYRSLEEIPVLAKAGAILPMVDEQSVFETNSTDNPEKLHVKVFTGGSGAFTMWEDEGTMASEEDTDWCATRLEQCVRGNEMEFKIFPAEGNLRTIPVSRSWSVEFVGAKAQKVTVEINGEIKNDRISGCEIKDDVQGISTRVTLSNIPVSAQIVLKLTDEEREREDGSRLKRAEDILMKAQTPYDQKQQVYTLLKSGTETIQIINQLYSMNLNSVLYGALVEILSD